MGDQYKISGGQIGVVGPQGHAHDIAFTQQWNQIRDNVDLAQLAQELQRLREALDHEASVPDHKLAIGAIAAAEQWTKGH